jgi:hypothetical protein
MLEILSNYLILGNLLIKHLEEYQLFKENKYTMFHR